MSITIKPLGMSEEEIKELEKVEGKWKADAKKSLIAMHETPLPTDPEIDDLEQAFGKFPVEYRNFLLKFNGGAPDPNIIATADNELVVNFFLPAKHPPSYEDGLRSYYENYKGRIPKGMLPVASAGGGDLILLQLGDVDNGRIYYWSHELESENDAAAYFENVEMVAESFEFLLNSFRDLD